MTSSFGPAVDVLGEQQPRLSVLESTAVPDGASGYQAIEQTVAVAKAADRLGYHRFWVTEHHSQQRIASTAPAVLVAHIAAQTATMRIGSGGVMVTNHAPLVVAEQFSTLEALHPGRIDLGVGGASGTVEPAPACHQALGRTPRSASEYRQRLDELMGFLAGSFPSGHPYADVLVSPRVDAVPVFVLGSSLKGAFLAAERGLPFAFAHHLGVSMPEPVLRQYRGLFPGSASSAGPYVLVSVAVLCAETDAAAERLAIGAGLSVRAQQDHLVVGGPATVAEGLRRLALRTEADELMVVPVERSGEARVRTIRMVAAGYRAAVRPMSAMPVMGR